MKVSWPKGTKWPDDVKGSPRGGSERFEILAIDINGVTHCLGKSNPCGGGGIYPASEGGEMMTDGISLRDTIAIEVMKAMLIVDVRNFSHEVIAKRAYEMADKMLIERIQEE